VQDLPELKEGETEQEALAPGFSPFFFPFPLLLLDHGKMETNVRCTIKKFLGNGGSLIWAVEGGQDFLPLFFSLSFPPPFSLFFRADELGYDNS